jgi:hypothetical protein
MKEICGWCQKEITSNPIFAFVTIRKRLVVLRKATWFYFHNRGEMML